MDPALVLLGALLATGAPQNAATTAPVSFEIRWSRQGPLLRGVPVTIALRAVGASGETLESFDGRVELEGVVRDGNAVRESERFVRGELEIDEVEAPTGTVVVRYRRVEARSARPVLPGFLTLLPPLLAIALAVLTRQVLLALFFGVFVGVFILSGFDPLSALLRCADTYFVGALADPDHASILLFSLTLAGLVGIMTTTGGIRGIVQIVSRRARGPRSGQFATWLLGLLIFFDDYANSLIVGNTMRPFTDGVRISREKLSFIVDATAAPVATVGVISTWTAYQVGLVGDELPALASATQDPYRYFLRSIPASFYSFLMILLVLLSAVTLRDFGPMRRAEQRCRKTGDVLREGARPLVDASIDRLGDSADVKPRWYNAAVPIACVIGFTVTGLYFTDFDSYRSLLWAALGASLVAGLMGLLQKHRLGTVVDSWVSGVRSLVLAAVILVLAWSIGAVCKDLDTGAWVVSVARDLVAPGVVPCLAFLTAGLIAFATGTSYGTMAILIPILFPLAYSLSAAGGLGPGLTDRIGLGTLAAILGGSVFGDHCSPISDTTVLSSMASGADHIDHVRTQLPYAVLVGMVTVPCYVLLGLGLPAPVILPAGLAVVAGLFFAVTRQARGASPPNGG